MAAKELIKDGHTVNNVYAAGNNIGWICKGGETIWRAPDLVGDLVFQKSQIQDIYNSEGHILTVVFYNSNCDTARLVIKTLGMLFSSVLDLSTQKTIAMIDMGTDASGITTYRSVDLVSARQTSYSILCSRSPSRGNIDVWRECYNYVVPENP